MAPGEKSCALMLERSIAHDVFSVFELFEEILGNLTLQDLFRLQLVSTLFRDSIVQSNKLKRIMFLEPALLGNVVPLLIPLRLPRRLGSGVPPRFETIWAKAPEISADFLSTQHVLLEGDKLPNEVLLALCRDAKVERPVLNPTMDYWCVNRKLDTIFLKEKSASHAEIGLRLVPKSCKSLSSFDSRRRMLVTQPPVADIVVGRSDSRYGIYEAHNAAGVTIGDILDAEAESKDRGHPVPVNRVIRQIVPV